MNSRRPRLRIHHQADSGRTVCRVCHHPIEHFAAVGWVDITPPDRGGLYDFCTADNGAHIPETDHRRPSPD